MAVLEPVAFPGFAVGVVPVPGKGGLMLEALPVGLEGRPCLFDVGEP